MLPFAPPRWWAEANRGGCEHAHNAAHHWFSTPITVILETRQRTAMSLQRQILLRAQLFINCFEGFD
jgi:hypothetical protein